MAGRHPIYGNARYHSGIDIGGDYGMNIYAADSGTVTYSAGLAVMAILLLLTMEMAFLHFMVIINHSL